jgi:hypothetical protein
MPDTERRDRVTDLHGDDALPALADEHVRRVASNFHCTALPRPSLAST